MERVTIKKIKELAERVERLEEPIWIFKGKKYFHLKKDALSSRRKGDRLYYCREQKAYYLVRPIQRSWW